MEEILYLECYWYGNEVDESTCFQKKFQANKRDCISLIHYLSEAIAQWEKDHGKTHTSNEGLPVEANHKS